MKIIIQCASRKHKKAPTFKLDDGRNVTFVAQPDLVESRGDQFFCRPDDIKVTETQESWRAYLTKYNNEGTNRAELMRAGDLYCVEEYQTLIKKFGYEDIYILSAGWGLIRADFLIPFYDITFCTKAEKHLIRRSNDKYADYNHLIENLNPDEDIYFFGGLDYLPLYYRLTQQIQGRKVIYYCSKNLKMKTGYHYIKYSHPKGRNTNWHLGCIMDFINSKIPS